MPGIKHHAILMLLAFMLGTGTSAVMAQAPNDLVEKQIFTTHDFATYNGQQIAEVNFIAVGCFVLGMPRGIGVLFHAVYW